MKAVKQLLGTMAADRVLPGMYVGLGTGSTVYWLLQELGRRVANGLHFKAVPTSQQTADICEQLGIPLITLEEIDQPLALTIDGADEMTPDLHLIKGGGGALLREKIVAAASDHLIVIVDSSKYVSTLGTFPLPVEVIPFGWKQVARKIHSFGTGPVVLREKEGKPFVTDHGHFILDCHFKVIVDPIKLNEALHLIPGVVETGLFAGMASEALIGYRDGTIKTIYRT